MKPIIRAAIDSGRPPLELLLNQPGRERDRWDGMLIKGLYLLESYEVDGYPIWIEESPNVNFVGKTRILRSAAALDAVQKRHEKSDTKGLRFYVDVDLRPGAKWPTRREWMERRSSGERVSEDGAMAERVAEAEARAKEKVDADPELQRIVAEFQKKFNSTPDKIEE